VSPFHGRGRRGAHQEAVSSGAVARVAEGADEEAVPVALNCHLMVWQLHTEVGKG
jgi:hypothetical protein